MAATTELFDPVARTFADAAPMTMPRSGHSATALPDGRVLLVGGSRPETGVSVAGAELYDPTTGRSSATGSMLTERRSPSAALLDDGRVMVAGGENAYGIARSAEIYDPATGTFQLAASALGGLTGPALRLSDGRVLVEGLQSEVFDPAGSTPIASPPIRTDHAFVPTGEGAQHRSMHTATRLRDGRVLIAGGDEPVDGVLASAEIYDPRTGTSLPTGSMAVPRSGHTAIMLHDGRVLIAGWGGGQDAPVLEIYDPRTGRFSDAGSIPTGHRLGPEPITAVQLASGRIIIFGQIGTGSMAYELDPDQRLATAIGDVYGCTGLHEAVVLADDRVLALCSAGQERQAASLFDTGSGKSVRLVVPFFDGPVLHGSAGRWSCPVREWLRLDEPERVRPGDEPGRRRRRPSSHSRRSRVAVVRRSADDAPCRWTSPHHRWFRCGDLGSCDGRSEDDPRADGRA